VTKPQTPDTGRQTPDNLRSFWLMFVVEFQNAFSDNVLRWLVTFMIVGMGFSMEKRDSLVPLVGVIFALPFVLFSMAGGFFADRFSKRSVAIAVKCAELGIMSVVTVGLWRASIPLMLAGIFLMSTHSAIFGPTKYGMLPELLPEKKLSWGNGIFGLGTFSAAITGTIFAGLLSDLLGRRQIWSGAILLALALVGLSLCLGVTRLPAADPRKKFRANFLGDFFSQLKAIRRDRVLFLGVMGNTFLSFMAMLLQLTVVFYGKDIFHLDDRQSGYLQGGLLVGVGAGSLAAGFLSGGKIEYGLIPLGMAGLTIFSGLLSHAGFGVAAFSIGLGLLGFFGGFYNVPVNAIIQHRPDADKKGRVIATAALLSWVGIFLASGVYYLLTVPFHLKSPQIFLFGAVLSLAGTVYCVKLMPDSLLRFVLWLLTRTIYRIRVDGRDNIPEKGGALFVCNHASWMDALLLLASTDRQIRFLAFKDIYENRWVHWGARILGVIPISAEQHPRELIQSLQTASDAIRNGEVVCIFAEGQITRIGQLLPFRRGMERIMKGVDAPIVPVALDGVTGSISSYEHHRFVWRWPRQIPHPVTVGFGVPLPPTATPFETRQAVQELLASAWRHRRDRMKPLHRQFVRTARKFPLRFAMADAQNKKVTFGAALVKTVFLARRLKKIWAGQEMVGIFLPPSVPGALVNYAALLCGKVPVNLNYTLSEAALASCAKQCELKTVITSRLFLEKVKLAVPCETVYLEDVVGAPSTASARNGNSPQQAGTVPGAPTAMEKITAFLMAAFLPAKLLKKSLSDETISLSAPSGRGEGRGENSPKALSRFEPLQPQDAQVVDNQIGDLEVHGEVREKLDSLATIIFSSGSTGEPKGVMLSHYNIGSNIEQMDQVFDLNRHDRFLGILPFFHSFGFTGTLWLPATLGVGVVFHPNPLDARTIGPLVKHHAVTYLLATPTFLQIYLRGCAPGDFGSLRLVMTAAEKLPDRLATAFEAHFGIRPMEGYGCTECSPTVAVNTPDFRAAGFHQVGVKRGTIGHPLPGVSVRIVDAENPWNGHPLPLGQAGLLLVRGPNVMCGYLGKPEKTAEVLRCVAATPSSPIEARAGATRPPSCDEASQLRWYCTGDVAALDEDGFLQITDRLNRFSKIGGEMVPHIKIEEHLHELAGATEQTFVVTGVPDEKKGERLVVLHKLPGENLAGCLEKLAQSNLPNLWKPRADQFFRVENFPLLGSGKLDLRKVKELAAKFSTNVGQG
jgi:acyl-[acyl-carrier-protein]-phospholipid O-acyltransferase/long-chain-fatty-acid--[acyl-carrier-protein] ligase